MHASISAHIAADYLLDEASGQWGPSLEEFERRLGTPAAKSHLENLYFAYLFVLRAVMKAGPALEQADLSSGLPVEDKLTRQLMDQLVSVHNMRFPRTFMRALLVPWQYSQAQDAYDGPGGEHPHCKFATSYNVRFASTLAVLPNMIKVCHSAGS